MASYAPLGTQTSLSDDQRRREHADSTRTLVQEMASDEDREYRRALRRLGCDIDYASRYILPRNEWDEMVMKAGDIRRRIKERRAAQFNAFMRGE